MSHGLIAERDPTGGGQESGVRRTAPRARLLDSQDREGRRHQGAGLDPFAAGPFLLRRHERRGEGLTRDDDDGRNGSLTTGVCLASDPAGTAMELVDRSEPLVLLDDPVDLRVLMIERDREPEGFDPDRLVLQAREPDGLGATTVGALAQVGIDPVAGPQNSVGPLFGPLVHLPEDGLIDRLLVSPVRHVPRYSLPEPTSEIRFP